LHDSDGILEICLGWAARARTRKGQTLSGYLHFLPWKCSDPSPTSWVNTEQYEGERPGSRVCVLKNFSEHLQTGNFLWKKGVFLVLCLICQTRCSTLCRLFCFWSAADEKVMGDHSCYRRRWE